MDKPSHGSRNQYKEAVPSTRQRLRQWRKDNDTSATSTGSADPEYSKPPGRLSTQIHIPAPNSLVTGETQDDLAGADFIDHDPDPLREYRDDWAASLSRLNPGDLLDITVYAPLLEASRRNADSSTGPDQPVYLNLCAFLSGRLKYRLNSLHPKDIGTSLAITTRTAGRS